MLAPLTADLVFGSRDAHHQQRVFRRLSRLAYRLCESKLGVKGPGGKIAAFVQLSGVGHPFVN